MFGKSLRSLQLVIFSVALAASAGVPLLGQERPIWMSSSEIRDGVRGTIVGAVQSIATDGRTLTLRLDDNQSAVVRVSTDKTTTSYRSFGDGTSTDVQRGSQGFSQIHAGDRVRIAGVGGPRNTMAATEVVLVGRSSSSSGTPTRGASLVTGTVRSVDSDDYQVVLETSDRSLHTYRGDASTPVNYRGNKYEISNLEPGDQVRIQLGPGPSDEIRIVSIEVLRDVNSDGAIEDTRTISSLNGRVTRIERGTTFIRIQPEQGREVRVDLTNARSAQGQQVRSGDVRVGDEVQITGRYDGTDFRASVVRIGEDIYAPTSPTTPDRNGDWRNGGTSGGTRNPNDRTAIVVIDGTISQSLADAGALVIRDTTLDRNGVRVLADDDLIVRTSNGGYISAVQLREGERVTIRAFVDSDNNYIAQTIRIR